MAKYDSNWWFGKNSVWGKLRPDNVSFMGAEASWEEDKSGVIDWGNFAVPTEIDLSDDLKLGLLLIGSLIMYKMFLK